MSAGETEERRTEYQFLRKEPPIIANGRPSRSFTSNPIIAPIHCARSVDDRPILKSRESMAKV